MGSLFNVSLTDFLVGVKLMLPYSTFRSIGTSFLSKILLAFLISEGENIL